MKAQLLAAVLVMGTLVGCGQGAVPALETTRDAGILWLVPLRAAPAYPAANGKAKYQDRGGEQEFQVEIEDVRSLRGKTLGVFVGGNRVGGARVNSLGEGRLELNSDLGQNVPTVNKGTRVQVKTAAGTLVVSGSF